MALKIPAKRIFGDNFDPGKQKLYCITVKFQFKFEEVGHVCTEEYNCSELFFVF